MFELQYHFRFLFDYKSTDPGEHKKYTGVDREPIIRNLRRICAAGKTVVLRCPIVPGVNDFDSHFDAIAALANELGTVERIDLEPYHELGAAKYAKFGKAAAFSATPPDKTRMEQIRDYIQNKTPKRVIIS